MTARTARDHGTTAATSVPETDTLTDAQRVALALPIPSGATLARLAVLFGTVGPVPTQARRRAA